MLTSSWVLVDKYVILTGRAGNKFASETPAETTYFRFASNTKNFTATAILNMYEDGWLDYKAHITDLIPGTSIPYLPNKYAGLEFPQQRLYSY